MTSQPPSSDSMGSGTTEAGPGRLVWLVTSPRVPAGLLSWPAWETLRRADHVVVTDPEHPLRPAVHAAGVAVEVLAADDPVAGALAMAGADALVVWIAGDEDTGLGERLGHAVAMEAERGGTPPELEVLAGSYDMPGARLLDLVAVMDRLRRWCPWDAEQTHRSLVRYLLEETYETIEALENGAPGEIREELGDLAFQVFFHARVAEDDPEEPWTIDDLAGEVVDKLIRRHPHVFADTEVSGAAEVEANWEAIKSREKPRTSPVEGVPRALPALALAEKVLTRLDRNSSAVEVGGAAEAGDLPDRPGSAQVGAALLRVVDAARRGGVDPEQALRDAVRHLIGRVRGDDVSTR